MCGSVSFFSQILVRVQLEWNSCPAIPVPSFSFCGGSMASLQQRTLVLVDSLGVWGWVKFRERFCFASSVCGNSPRSEALESYFGIKYQLNFQVRIF